jgi:hypothetical protein
MGPSGKFAPLVVELISLTGVVVVIVKLCAIVVPVYVRLPAAFMVTGWACIQVLYRIPVHGSDGVLITDELVRRTVQLERRLYCFDLWLPLMFGLSPLFWYWQATIWIPREAPVPGKSFNEKYSEVVFPAFIYWVQPFLTRKDKGLWNKAFREYASFWNLFTGCFIFVGVMVTYDADRSYKPGWLEWLG